MNNTNLSKTAKVGDLRLNSGYFQYSILGRIITIVYKSNEYENLCIVSYNKNNITDIHSLESMLNAIESSNIPIYIFSKDTVISFIEDNFIQIPEDIKDEFFDLIEDFNRTSFKDLINALYWFEYGKKTTEWMLAIIKKMKENELQPYIVNDLIVDICDVLSKFI